MTDNSNNLRKVLEEIIYAAVKTASFLPENAKAIGPGMTSDSEWMHKKAKAVTDILAPAPAKPATGQIDLLTEAKATELPPEAVPGYRPENKDKYRGRPVRVRCVETGRIFKSQKAAADWLGCNNHMIIDAVSTKTPARGLHFEKVSA